MATISITLPDTTMLRTLDNGDVIRLDWTKLSAEVIAKIAEGGAKIIAINTFNSGGKDRTEVERAAALNKRLDAWYRGEYVMVERGESQYTAMREQYYQERLETAGATRNEVDKAIKALVAKVFGEKESATFAKFIAAVATEKLKAMGKDAPEGATVESIGAAIEEGLAKRAAEAAAKRAEKAKELDVAGIDLGL